MAHSSFRLPRRATQWLSSAGLACALSAGCATPPAACTDPASPYPSAPPSHAGAAAKHPEVAAQTPIAPATATTGSNAQLHLAYGQLQEQKGEMAGARLSYERAIQASPAFVEAHVGLGRLDLAAGRPQQAEQHLRDAIRLQPRSAYALAAMGQFFGDQGQWNESLEFYGQAMNAAPDDKRYAFQMAVALTKSGRVDQAVPLFTRSVGEAPGHHNVAVILQEQGDLAGAEKHARMALAKDPNLAQAKELLSNLGLGGRAQVRARDPGPTIRPAPVAGTAENYAARGATGTNPVQQTSGTVPIRTEANTGSLRITAGKSPTPADRQPAASNWTAPVPESNETEWQRMPIAPRNPLGSRQVQATPTRQPSTTGGLPPEGSPEWEQWKNQTSSTSLR